LKEKNGGKRNHQKVSNKINQSLVVFVNIQRPTEVVIFFSVVGCL
jgi:hypothetical protein